MVVVWRLAGRQAQGRSPAALRLSVPIVGSHGRARRVDPPLAVGLPVITDCLVCRERPIRDGRTVVFGPGVEVVEVERGHVDYCLLYTSDAADE